MNIKELWPRFRGGAIAVSACMLALGIVSTAFAVFLLANPFTGAAALMIFAGASLIVSAAQNFYLLHGVSRAVRASRRNDVIEVTWEDVG